MKANEKQQRAETTGQVAQTRAMPGWERDQLRQVRALAGKEAARHAALAAWMMSQEPPQCRCGDASGSCADCARLGRWIRQEWDQHLLMASVFDHARQAVDARLQPEGS